MAGDAFERERMMALFQAALGLALTIAGGWLLVAFLWATAPGRVDSGVLRADAVVTSQSATPSGWTEQKFPASVIVYREGFEFTDATGANETGQDEVSAKFYLEHPVGTPVPVYYYPDAPDRAVIDTPARLFRQRDVMAIVIIAPLLLLGGLALVIWRGREWLLLRNLRRASRVR